MYNNISSLLFISFPVVVHPILHPSREELSRLYMHDISHSDDERDNMVELLTILFRGGATIRDVRGEEMERGIEGGNKEDRERETKGVEEDVREEPLEPLDVPTPSSFQPMEGILLEMERRMRKHIEEMGQSIQSRIDHGFSVLNAKIN